MNPVLQTFVEEYVRSMSQHKDSTSKYIHHNDVVLDILGSRPKADVLQSPSVGTPEFKHDVNPAPDVLRLRQYIRWLPIVALVRDLDGRTVMANNELSRLVGREDILNLKVSDYWDPRTAACVEAHDHIVRVKRAAILCLERIPVKNTIQNRLVIRFPILDDCGNVKLTGALGFDLEKLHEAEALKSRETGRRPCRVEVSHRLVYRSDYSDSLLADFAKCVPLVMAVKGPEGHLLWANPWFYHATGKNSAVIGRLASENWPPETSDLIIAHDQLVRETGVPFLSVETISGMGVCHERLNLRFPIFDPAGKLEMTGVLGFHYGMLKEVVDALSEPGGRDTVFVFESDGSENFYRLSDFEELSLESRASTKGCLNAQDTTELADVVTAYS